MKITYKLTEKDKRILRKFCKKGMFTKETIHHLHSKHFIGDALHDGLLDLVLYKENCED